MNIILKPFAVLLLLLNNVVNNYGIALFIFALIVKVILFPASLKGKKGMIKMNMLNGQIMRLQKAYGNNQVRYNEEVQKLYEREKVNPMGGCLWTMVPLLILIPLYSIIRQPLQYIMDLTPEQMAMVANALNWDTVAVEMGWVTQKAVDAAIAAAQEAGTVISGFTSAGYNELYLAGMINESNLAVAQAAAGEAANVFAMNFNFLGINLSHIPNWMFWSNGLDWTTIGLFLLVVVSCVSSIVSSKIMMKTNNMNNPNQNQNAQADRTSKTMMWMSPVMSLWFGFMMPGLLTIYWIANNVLGVAQELISSRILKADYEKAAKLQAETAAREKEEEKKRKRELAEKRAKEAEEAKKNKKLAAELRAAEDKGDSAAIPHSRVGMRAYARGRAYDPERFGGVTPYCDPDVMAREQAAAEKKAEEEKAAKKGKKGKKAAEKPVEQPKPVEEKVTAAPVAEEVAAPVSEEAVEEAVESVVEDTKAGE